MSPVLRSILDEALDGPSNMARDEALLTSVGSGESPPTLRLYQWSPPTVSLGYFQRFADFEALGPPANELAVVRRLTGGGAILHDREWTYSLALPVGHPLLAHGPNRLYELAHDAIMTALARQAIDARRSGCTDDSSATRGPFFCFARRHCFDLLSDGAKIAGSAQRRTRIGVLQHGSIILARRFHQQPSATLNVPYESLAPGMALSLTEEFGRSFDVPIQAGHWSVAELRIAQGLASKYGGLEWTRRY